MSSRGLPASVQMRHDSHYVEELATAKRAVGRTIAIDKIEPNPDQPRVEFGDLTDLTNSIREKGVLEPLLVKPNASGTFMIIAGERRWRASRLAGLSEVPCIEMDLDEKEIAEIALIENLQRKDLNIWEEADGLRALADKFGYTQDDIARKISKSRSTVTELMTIAGLPLDIRERCRTADISSKSTLLEVARQFNDAAMNEFLDKLITGEKVPRTKQPKKGAVLKTEVRHAEALSEPAAKGYSFSFQGDDPQFEVVLKFNDRETVQRGEILRALKKAFDAVKSEETEI